MFGTILLSVLVLVILGTVPHWPHSKEWGYMPSGGLGIVAFIVFMLWIFGHV